ncbi:serine hydrolase domain-containing protein [Ponticaulis sp.]|uniref:serine hydrolase domain-containing protein n=1 Tax=Ponticaulis sp. TaxID=2020902 RepID=UPI000B6C634F|nr:serine hydrolase domain-containing protein [Ponticaulis sp.]MAJ08042.1 esterase [Ponticaulis sp.]RPG18348.1 MAG: class A beta-lactamase-related serine hydrolase [Hyphomonadaceae bacterium TMED125]HBJ94074.1 esterase [Hyphomonadaceae bacterium]|tara:strand:+ start:50403 stop:51545 length:1143 start_codon:yes stop_codon:yes gene_type:complete
MELSRGHVKAGFEDVRRVFEENFADDGELGAGFAAYQDGECIISLQGGFADRAKTRPFDEHTLTPVYSTTKPIAALVVGHVVDQAPGITLDTRVAEFWPEFAAEGKDDLTIADLLSHQAGLCGFEERIDPALWLKPRELSAKLAETAPLWSPVPDGTSGYHPLTWGYLAGEIVERLAGHSLGTVLAEDITGTAAGGDDVIDFWVGTPESQHDRISEIMRPKEMPKLGDLNRYNKAAFLTAWSAPERGTKVWREVEIPSANGHGTAQSVARLYSAFANQGVVKSPLMSSDTWNDFLTVRTTGQDRVLPFNIEFAAGVMGNNSGFYGPNPNSWGHSGWGGSAAFGDPDNRLSCAYVMNKQSAYLQGDPRAQRLFDAVYDCLD